MPNLLHEPHRLPEKKNNKRLHSSLNHNKTHFRAQSLRSYFLIVIIIWPCLLTTFIHTYVFSLRRFLSGGRVSALLVKTPVPPTPTTSTRLSSTSLLEPSFTYLYVPSIQRQHQHQQTFRPFHSSRMTPRVPAKKKTTADESTEDTAVTKETASEEIKKPKRSRRGVKNEETTEQKEASPAPSKPAKRSKNSVSDKDNNATASTKRTKAPSKKKAKAASKEDSDKSTSGPEPSPPKRAKKTPAHQVLTERDVLPKLWDESKARANGSYTFKIASWNVAGLRALMKNAPAALPELVKKHDLDVLCLQETKLQEQHLDDPKLAIRGRLLEAEGYDAYYSCSTMKKGYSGTAVFVRRRSGAIKTKFSKESKKQTTLGSFLKTGKNDTAEKEEAGSKKDEKSSSLPIDASELVPLEVTYKIGKEKHDTEGRLIIVDFPLFSMINVYVPNSGQKLERLDYRTEEWDKDLLAFVQKKQSDRGLPVMWVGDLNVAHTNLEVWNDGAKHLSKQAGVTPQERASFQAQLDSGFIDSFRRLHGDAKGHYSYWSQRAGNREPNKGLRLDYFVCNPALFEEDSRVVVRDSYMDFEQLGSDHAPVILELEIKPSK